ncbi:MAG: 4-hydroxy-3-methylbut-2-enyl diphosphate reductase [Blastochloris viridis]|uniref:4-hydroxy-3-methylbut-2-enyl diphosphate reductase n=1 Tax=Blastochloris viridis TaxID=1079 RepID=A0A6N4RES6_BLAVI|nr:MAG: 4-hydroxy-3-methylbut-2-enyl diphosphate reductase [Blastochloris viridis]
MTTPTPQQMTILLCAPRGFCAGVSRAISMVEASLERFGAPVYVRHEIVHNKTVVERLRAKGAVFVEQLKDIPLTKQPVVFSAHGVSKAVVAEAETRGFLIVDATCPLVSKVHNSAERLYEQGNHIVMIGHAGHVEVEGTRGQIPAEASTLVETVADAETVVLPDGPLAVATQTTLSVDETQDIIAKLLERFPHMKQPKKEDICYATTNRQAAVKEIAARCDALLVVGAPNSSNSKQLVNVAQQYGCDKSVLVQRAEELDMSLLDGVTTLGLTAGASAPEDLVQAIIDKIKETRPVTVEEVVTTEENYVFKMPQFLTEPMPEAAVA